MRKEVRGHTLIPFSTYIDISKEIYGRDAFSAISDFQRGIRDGDIRLTRKGVEIPNRVGDIVAVTSIIAILVIPALIVGYYNRR